MCKNVKSPHKLPSDEFNKKESSIICWLNKSESTLENNTLLAWFVNTQKPLRTFCLMLAVVFIIFIMGILIFMLRGTGGETIFSAIQAIFSGLAFSGMLAALSLQKQELNDTRKELEFTKKATQEIAKTASQELDIKVIVHKLSTLNTLITESEKEITQCDNEIRKLEIEKDHCKIINRYNNEMDKLKDRYFELIDKNNIYHSQRAEIMEYMYKTVIQ